MNRIHKYTMIAAMIMATFLLISCSPQEIELDISADPQYFTQAGEMITLSYEVNFLVYTGETFRIRLERLDDYYYSTCSLGRWEWSDFSYSCTVIYITTEADVANGGFVHTNKVIGYTEENQRSSCGVPRNNSDTASIEVPYLDRAILEISIYSLPPTFSRVGEEIHYTFTIRNIGAFPATEPVTIEDSLLEVDCPNIPPLNPQEHITCTATYTSGSDDLLAGVIQNISVATAGSYYSEEFAFEIPLNPQPALSLVITASPNYYAFQGDKVTLSYEVTNTGNVPLSGPFEIITENPLDWSCPTTGRLQIGEVLTCSGSIQITHAEYGYHLTHQAQVQGTHTDQTVQSSAASVTIFFSPPPSEPTPEPGFNCSALSQGPCLDYPDVCSWDESWLVCRNK